MKNLKNVGTALSKAEQKTISGNGNGPSGRRCDRLWRRGMNGSASALDTWFRICDTAQ